MELRGYPSEHVIGIYTQPPSDKSLLAKARLYLQKQEDREKSLEEKLDEVVNRFGSADFEAQRIRKQLSDIDNEAHYFDAHGQKVCAFRIDFGKVSRV